MSYNHPTDPNLNNLHKAMEFNQSGEPVIRTSIGDLINISGNVIIPGNISIDSSNSSPLFTHISQIGTGNILTVDYIPISGNVDAKITNDVGNSIPIYGNINASQSGNWNVNINNSTSSPALVKITDGAQLDSYGKLKISQVASQWWHISSVDKDSDIKFVEQFSGTNAASYFIQNLASVQLTSGSDSNGFAIRASKRRHKIHPGISHEWLGTFNWDGIQQNVIKRKGLFTNFNGFFFELGTDLSVVIRKRLTDGTLVENRVSRLEFNGDKLDGTGTSGINLTSSPVTATPTGVVTKSNITIGLTTVYNVIFNMINSDESKFSIGSKVTVSGITPSTFNGIAMVSNLDTITHQITLTYTIDPGTFISMSGPAFTQTPYHMEYTYWFDFYGGRTDKARFGIITSNGPIILHTFSFSGDISTQFESAPALISRAEIINSGPVNYFPSFTLSGHAFNIETPEEHNNYFASAANNNYITYSTSRTDTFPVLGIGLRTGEPYQRGEIQVQSIQFFDLNNVINQNTNPAIYYWQLILNPTLGGTIPTPTNIGKVSRQWAFTGNSTVTGGYVLMSGYSNSQNTTSDVHMELNFLNLGSNIDYSDSDKLVLVIQQIKAGSNNGKLIAIMNFMESL